MSKQGIDLMSRVQLTLEEAAKAMGVATTTLKSMAVQGDMPYRMRSGNFVFSQDDIDLWLSKHVIDGDTRNISHGKEAARLSELCPRECVCSALPGNSRASIIKSLTELADCSGFLYDPEDLRAEITRREECGTTNIGKGIAIPHTLVREDGFFSDSFVCIARLAKPSYFNSAPDGSVTELLILSCCQDSAEHLNILRQISDICRLTNFMDNVRAAADDDELYNALLQAEQDVVKALRKK